MGKEKKPMSRISDQVFALAEPIAKEQGVELIDVKYFQEDKRWYLRLIIDKRGGINIDHCEALSRAVDPILDEKVEINQAYYLEVQSPGIDRPLETQADFLRYRDHEVELSFYQKQANGQKKISGILKDNNPSSLSLEIAGNLEVYPLEEIANVKRVIRF